MFNFVIQEVASRFIPTYINTYRYKYLLLKVQHDQYSNKALKRLYASVPYQIFVETIA
jgi:hypothetical protein